MYAEKDGRQMREGRVTSGDTEIVILRCGMFSASRGSCFTTKHFSSI